MQRILLRMILGTVVLIVPMTAVAGISLSPIMESWNHSKRDIAAMLSAGKSYDEAQLRQELQRYIDSASRVSRGVRGDTADARDFAARFDTFANDSRSVLGKVGDRSAVTAGFNRMLDDCRSCHATYNN